MLLFICKVRKKDWINWSNEYKAISGIQDITTKWCIVKYVWCKLNRSRHSVISEANLIVFRFQSNVSKLKLISMTRKGFIAVSV